MWRAPSCLANHVVGVAARAWKTVAVEREERCANFSPGQECCATYNRIMFRCHATCLRKALVVCLAALPLAESAQEDGWRETLSMNGAFLQYHNGNLAGNWKASFTSMTALGMDTVVLQYLRFDDADFVRENNDPTERILELADEHNHSAAPGRRVRVFIGLANVGNWNGGRGRDAEETRRRVAAARTGCTELAARVKRLYGEHASFFGWYIPMEGDNCYDPDDAGTLSAIHDLYKDISQECKRLLDKPVAMSVFFNTGGGCYDAGQTARAYTRILTGCNVQYLLLQDGVGERNWDGRIRENIAPFFEAFSKVCSGTGVELWGVPECFRFLGKDKGRAEQRVPLADAVRLKAQLQAIQAHGVKTTVGFEFYAYLDPNPHAPQGDAGHGMRKALYEDYARRIAGDGNRP